MSDIRSQDLDKAASASEAALSRLSRRIEEHSESDASRSWLGWAVGLVWHGDEDSLRELKTIQYEARRHPGSAPDDARIDELLLADRQAQAWQDELAHYGTGFLKTAALFMRGRAGLAGTVTLFALDQGKHTDSLKEQLADLSLGGVKGGLLKATFHLLAQKDLSVAARGVGLGVTSRALDAGLARGSYTEAGGDFSLGAGLANVVKTSLDRTALAADVVVFSGAHFLSGRANALTGDAIKRSPLLSTMLTGSTFGMSSGATHEILRQHESGENIDVSKIIGRALIQGALDTAAAAPGGIQGDAAFRQKAAERIGRSADLLAGAPASLKSSLASIEGFLRQWQSDRNLRKTAISVVLDLQKAGHTAVFAGGSVRDELMGRKPKDFDIATSATPGEVEKLFARTILDGKDYGVIKVVRNGVVTDVATLRQDGQYSDGRRPDSVAYLTRPGAESLKADAARRDFTINAMFKDPISGRLYDFFGGREDIHRGVIRAVGNADQRIMEDRLRMLRAARFASRYGFAVDAALEASIARHADKINGANDGASGATAGFGERSAIEKPVSGERIREEIFGILASKRPLVGLDLMMRTGLMKAVLPEVAETNTRRGDQDPTWHPEGNTWVHTRMIIEQLARLKASRELMFAGLLHDIGKPLTQQRHPDGGISNHRHDEVGAEMAREIAGRLKLSNEQKDRVVTLVREHMRMHKGAEMRPPRLAELLENKYIQDMIALQHADAVGTGRADRLTKSLRPFYERKLDELTRRAAESQRLGAAPLVTGATLIELGLKPGPQFKQFLKDAQDAQREGQFRTKEEADRWARERFGKKVSG